MARGNKLMPLTLVALVIAAALTLDAQAAWAASCGGTQGTALRLGCDNNTSTDTTVINYPTNSTTALYVHATGSGGLAVNGRGTYGISGVGDVTGTAGQGGTFGVYGTSPKTAVYGHGGTYGVFGAAATGVYGTSAQGCVLLGGCGAGVSGTNTSNGFGVFGSSANGVGVTASSSNGTALSVAGKAHFSRSGAKIVPAGSESLTVTLAGVTTSSLVLGTAQQDGGKVYVKAVVPASGSFTILLTANAPAGGLKVAYFVLN